MRRFLAIILRNAVEAEKIMRVLPKNEDACKSFVRFRLTTLWECVIIRIIKAIPHKDRLTALHIICSPDCIEAS